jgi:hypothetical protein
LTNSKDKLLKDCKFEGFLRKEKKGKLQSRRSQSVQNWFKIRNKGTMWLLETNFFLREYLQKAKDSTCCQRQNGEIFNLRKPIDSLFGETNNMRKSEKKNNQFFVKV